MTDTQIRDRLNEILGEEFGDVLRNKEVDVATRHRILEKVLTFLIGRGAKAAGGKG
jgi:hypothetical protein